MFPTYFKKTYAACDAAYAPCSFSCSRFYESYLLPVLSTAVFAVLIFVVCIITLRGLLGPIPVIPVIILPMIGAAKSQCHLCFR